MTKEVEPKDLVPGQLYVVATTRYWSHGTISRGAIDNAVLKFINGSSEWLNFTIHKKPTEKTPDRIALRVARWTYSWVLRMADCPKSKCV